MRRLAIALLACGLAACGSTPRRDLEYDRLHASLQALSQDAEMARLALAERALAEAAVRRLDASSINAAEHAHLAYLAERRVDIAYIVAQTEQESARLAELEREHADLQLSASRRENEAMRVELERQRQRELLQQEERERQLVQTPSTGASSSAGAHGTPAAAVAPAAALPTAPSSSATAASTPALSTSAESAPVESAPAPAAVAPVVSGSAAPAAAAQEFAATPAAPPPPAAAAAQGDPASLSQRLATLAPEASADGEQITLEDLVFEPGTAQLVGEAGVGIARVAAFVNSRPERTIRVEGHTDATGSPDANRALSLRRAEAVRDALVASGVDALRIQVSGEGSARPVASNDEAEGRARNRRVVVLLRAFSG